MLLLSQSDMSGDQATMVAFWATFSNLWCCRLFFISFPMLWI